MSIVRRICPILSSVAIVLSGCAIEGRRGTLRFWADYNSLQTPALFVEQLSHYPDRDERVRHLRWMYNKPPFDGPYLNGVAVPPPKHPLRPIPSPGGDFLAAPTPDMPQTVPLPDAPQLLDLPQPIPLVPPAEPTRLPSGSVPHSGPAPPSSPVIPPPPAD